MPIAPQTDLFGSKSPESYQPNQHKVCARLQKILGEERPRETLPWDRSRLSLYRTIFPQMTQVFAGKRSRPSATEFQAEIDRLCAYDSVNPKDAT